MAVPGLVHRLGLQTLGTYHDRSAGALTNGAGPQPSLAAGSRAWGRLFGSTGHAGRTGAGASSRYSAFKEDGPRYEYDLAGMQLGLDAHRQLRQDGSGSTAGAYLGVSNASARVDAVLGGRAGRVSVNGYSLGGYWTHVGTSGAYIDAVAQVTRYHGVRARSVNGERISPDGWGTAASLEAGLPIALGGQWTLEPQAQIVHQHISFDGAQRDRYGKIDIDNADAWTGRVGTRLSTQWHDASGRRYGAWARANLWHDFGGRAKTTFAQLDGNHPVTLRTGLGGTWMQLGLGFDTQAASGLGVSVSAGYEQSLETSKGRGVSGYVGLRYAW